MKSIYIILISLVVGLILGFTISKISFQPQITANVIEESSTNYTYTTAICNENKECIDVLVECENQKVISLKPTSKLVEFPEDWEDFREEKEHLCS